MIKIRKLIKIDPIDFKDLYCVESFERTGNKLYIAIGTDLSTVVIVDYELGEVEERLKISKSCPNDNVLAIINMPFLRLLATSLNENLIFVDYSENGYEVSHLSQVGGSLVRLSGEVKSICSIDEERIAFASMSDSFWSGGGGGSYVNKSAIVFFNIPSKKILRNIKLRHEDTEMDPGMLLSTLPDKLHLVARSSYAYFSGTTHRYIYFIINTSNYQIIQTGLFGTSISLDYSGIFDFGCVQDVQGHSSSDQSSFTTDLYSWSNRRKHKHRNITLFKQKDTTVPLTMENFPIRNRKEQNRENKWTEEGFSFSYIYGTECIIGTDNSTGNTFENEELPELPELYQQIERSSVIKFENGEWKVLHFYDSTRYPPEYCVNNRGKDIFYCFEENCDRSVTSILHLENINIKKRWFGRNDPDEKERVEYLRLMDEDVLIKGVENIKICFVLDIDHVKTFKWLMLL